MCHLREALIHTQLAGWHLLPVLQMSAAFPGCYLTPLSASGIQEHIRLLGKRMFCKSKSMWPELMVTLEAVCKTKPLAFLMASSVQEAGRAPAAEITSPLTDTSELVTQIVRGCSADWGSTGCIWGVSPSGFSASYIPDQLFTSWMSLGKLFYFSECSLPQFYMGVVTVGANIYWVPTMDQAR